MSSIAIATVSTGSDVALTGEFFVTRFSKAGKATTRGLLGLLTSGNKAERLGTADRVIEVMLNNGNFRHVMREMDRVFTSSMLSKASNVAVTKVKGEADEIRFATRVLLDGRMVTVYDEYEGWTRANKHVFKAFARAVCELAVKAEDAGKEFKGEKAYFAEVCADWLDAQTEREQAAEIAKLEASIAAE